MADDFVSELATGPAVGAASLDGGLLGRSSWAEPKTHFFLGLLWESFGFYQMTPQGKSNRIKVLVCAPVNWP